MRRGAFIAVVGVFAGLVAAGCGSSDSGGRATPNLWVFNEPSGSFTDAAKRCSASSHGRYKIVYNKLSNDADQQRQSLVRRLAAKDSSIDIAGMDVVWTAEFAEAGWIKPWPARFARELTAGTLKGPLNTATYKGRIYAAPANTNTQLLWYRKDLVPKPATTWDDLINQAIGLKKAGVIQEQGARYEGVTVWFNALVASAGGTIVRNNKATPSAAWTKAAQIMHKLGTSKAADPSLSATKEDQARLAFENGEAAFQVNYPFIYPSAKSDKAKIFKDIAWKPYPRVFKDRPSKAPIGGINWGVGAYTKHPNEAFDAAACMRNSENEKEAAIKGGLPPTLESLYADPKLIKAYPFAALIRKQRATAAVRPVTPAYADVSLAVAKAVSPPTSIETNGFVNSLRGTLKDALNSQALL